MKGRHTHLKVIEHLSYTVKNLFHKVLQLFNFVRLGDFVRLYVAVLACIGLLATIGIFSIRYEPEIQILQPVYVYFGDRLIQAVQKTGSDKILAVDSSFKHKFCYFNYPTSRRSLFPPYEVVGRPEWQRSSIWGNKGASWYLLGVEDTIKDFPVNVDYAADRDEEVKRGDIQPILIADFYTLLDDSIFTVGCDSIAQVQEHPSINPFAWFHKNIPALGERRADELCFNMLASSEIYSIISINNHSITPLENINVFINDIVNTGMLKIIGWNPNPSPPQVTANGPNLRLSINELKPNQSIEIVVRGDKVVRRNEIQISASTISTVDSRKVILIMVWTFIGVLVAYMLDKIRMKITPQ